MRGAGDCRGAVVGEGGEDRFRFVDRGSIDGESCNDRISGDVREPTGVHPEIVDPGRAYHIRFALQIDMQRIDG